MFNCTRNCEWTLWIEIACAIIAMDLFVTPSISLYDLCHSTIQYVSFLYACTITSLQYVVITSSYINAYNVHTLRLTVNRAFC